MGISGAVHLVAILLYPTIFHRLPSGVVPYGTSAPASTLQGTELINLEEITPDREVQAPPVQKEPEAEPQAQAAPAEVAPSGVTTVPGPEGETEGEKGLSAAERLRPRAGDLRVWAPLNPEFHQLSEEEYLRLRLLAEIEAMADSAVTEDEIARRLEDWTYTDSEGRKWGVSPGKLHLGDITLPLPSFGSKGADLERVWEWERMEGAAARGDVMRSWKERDEAIRRRMNAKRKPDTTRVGG